MALLLAVAAALPAIFGLQLGAEVDLPECERMAVQYPTPGLKPPYLNVTEKTCQMLPDASGYGEVLFPVKAMPLITASPDMITLLSGGELQSVWAATLSHNNSDEIIRELSAKFGVPSVRAPETIEIQHIDVPSVYAIWRRDGYTVEYHAIGGNIDYGWVRVETDRAKSLREARDKAADAQRTPL